MKNYREKSLHHIKRQRISRLTVRESTNKSIELIHFEEPSNIFSNWEDCYNYLKSITRSTKRAWIERFVNQDNTIWDTDLEPEEQDCVDYLLEYFDYQQGSFEIEELRELLGENTDNENMVNTCSILIDALISNGKTLLEVE